MVVLGLGTNLGDRLQNLRSALSHLRALPKTSVEKISPVYISDALMPDNAPPSWNKPYLNLAVKIETTLSPYELLAHIKDIEKKVGRTPEKEWGPRIIDIDLLVWDDLIQYDEKLHIPHEHLHERPFVLWPLSDVAPFWRYPLPGALHGKFICEIAASLGSRFSGQAEFRTRQIPHRIDTPQLVGILNVTPDSFSDGNHYFTQADALTHAKHLSNSGADIIDIGAESTRPNATLLSPKEEWERLEPVLNILLQERIDFMIPPKISLDTRHAETAEKALAMGVDWINDVSALKDPAMLSVLKNSTADFVFMHHLNLPADNVFMTSPNITEALIAFAENKIDFLVAHGIQKERLIFDVGIGFGKTPEQSFELLNQMALIKQTLNVRIMVGHSRKSFLKIITEHAAKDRDIETTVLSLALAKQQIDYLRVHDVDLHARAFRAASTV